MNWPLMNVNKRQWPIVLLLVAPMVRADTFYLTIAGLGGEPEYEQRFTGWAKDLDKLLKTAEPNAHVDTLVGTGAVKTAIEAKLRDIAKQAKPDDSVVLMLIGHGSYDETDYKFNIPGPDITATEMANLLDKIPAKHQLVVDMTSSSGGALVSFQKPGRIVITATKSGTEKNITYFARYWIEALRDPAADTDKNDVISALEAFRYAEQKTAKFFESQNRLATEHPLLEDTGKGEGTKAPSPENGEGLAAGHFAMLHLAAVAARAQQSRKAETSEAQGRVGAVHRRAEIPQGIDGLRRVPATVGAVSGRARQDSGGARQVKFAVVLAAAISLSAQVSKKAVPQTNVSECQALRHHGDPNAKSCFEALTRSNDAGIRAEGYWGLRDFTRSNDEFLTALKAHPQDANLWTRRGRMFMEDAQPNPGEWFEKALDINPNYAPAILGMALLAEDGFEGKAAELAKKALTLDPKLVEAQELLARVALEDGNEEKAAAEANKALEMSPDALDAMSILATIDWLDDKKTTPWIGKILKINPMYGEAYATAGHFFVINRRYDEGIAAYRKALEIEPDLWSARSDLGVNLMRLGQDGEARKQLEECFNAGYQSVETRNTLTLLDSFKNFVTFETPTTALQLNKKEAALLRPYFQSELDRALAVYEKKYHYKLQSPVQVEVYPDHEDFAVRTMGMPGLGALGVTFEYHVAMDSPSGRPPGAFHWDSTMWHELSHVYVLAMTKSRVPRWFTEGLAVFEETGNGHPDWGDRLDPEAINAIKTKKLLPVSDLDRGFVHPTYPAQVTVSYFEAGKICNFINEKWGYAKLLAMVHDFAALTPTPAVIEKEFQMKPEEFDRQFLAWLGAQTKVTVDGFDEWKKGVKAMNEASKAKKWDDVIREGTAIRDLYSDYVEAGNVYEFLSDAYLAKGDKLKATAELERYAKIGGRNPATLKQLAKLEAGEGREQDAAATLERLNLIYLRDEDAHKQLGDLYMDLHNSEAAIREFQAVLAVGPIDQAGAHYELARALQAAHKTGQARDEVVSALEVAPGFKPAQKLLLELNVKE